MRLKCVTVNILLKWVKMGNVRSHCSCGLFIDTYHPIIHYCRPITTTSASFLLCGVEGLQPPTLTTQMLHYQLLLPGTTGAHVRTATQYWCLVTIVNLLLLSLLFFCVFIFSLLSNLRFLYLCVCSHSQIWIIGYKKKKKITKSKLKSIDVCCTETLRNLKAAQTLPNINYVSWICQIWWIDYFLVGPVSPFIHCCLNYVQWHYYKRDLD